MRTVLIADDHAVTRRGVRELMHEAFVDLEVVEAADVPGVLTALPTRTWDLILLDVMMPGGSVLDVLAAIRAHAPVVPVLVLTAAVEIEYVTHCLQAGANGLIHKHRASDELLDAVRKVAAGGTYLHADTAVQLAGELRPSVPPPHEKLSARERAVFLLIARGRAVKEIAGELGLSDKTVATYLARIRDKTGLSSHVDIARYALQHRLVD